MTNRQSDIALAKRGARVALMGRTTTAIVSGTAALLVAAAGCSSASAVAGGAPDAARLDVQNTEMADAESEASVSVEIDASLTQSGACASAGGVCMAGASTCTVVGPVHCGPDALCCLNMNALVVSADAAVSGPAAVDACASSACSDGAARASGDAAAE
jgi:hypothetical protein